MMSKKIFIALLVFATAVNVLLWQAHRTVSAPVPLRTNLLSDEQQAVLAVRSVKPAVVSIIGSRSSLPTGVPSDVLFGTGFIISSDGYIASNNHVVSDTSLSYRVILLDGKSLPARVIGVDTYSDIALLKVDGVSMATVQFGNSDSLETGQTVFAIGYALGKYQHTVTRGVVSGLGRDVSLDSSRPRYQNLIETDAAINPGNSGGPLVNTAGQVVGMNTLVEEGTGLGFAITGNYVKSALEQLRSLGKTSRAYIGVSYVDVTPSVQARYQLSAGSGAYIQEIASGGPAARAGLLPGDVILTINNVALTLSAPLDKVVAQFTAGVQVQLKVNRQGQVIDIPLILGEYK